jgi:hypothetical protein
MMMGAGMAAALERGVIEAVELLMMACGEGTVWN